MEFLSLMLAAIDASLRPLSLFLAITLCWSYPLTGQEADSGSQTAQQRIVATVAGQPITAGQVDRSLKKSLRGAALNEAQQRVARAATLERLINQRVVFDFLKTHQAAKVDGEVEIHLNELDTELKRLESSLNEYLEQSGLTLEEFRFGVSWKLTWQRYLDLKLTDRVLEIHFGNHKRELDGTELRVSHLLLKLPESADPSTSELEKIVQKASQIAAQLKTNPTVWGQVVQEHSEAPTKESGGEIGWIRINGPMPTAFTREAFKLSVGEVSPPVKTKFGLHLIRCNQIKEGKLGWRDTIDEVKKGAARVYFDSIVKNHRSNLKIELTEDIPSSKD